MTSVLAYRRAILDAGGVLIPVVEMMSFAKPSSGADVATVLHAQCDATGHIVVRLYHTHQLVAAKWSAMQGPMLVHVGQDASKVS